MKLLQSLLEPVSGWRDLSGDLTPADAQIVLVFGLRVALAEPAALAKLRTRFPSARLVLVSTAGNFANTRIEDAGLVCTAFTFKTATTRCASAILKDGVDLNTLCQGLARSLAAPDLRHVLVFSDGGLVNGTTLSESFNHCLPKGVTLSGGLAGDGTDFVRTIVGRFRARFWSHRRGGSLRRESSHRLRQRRWLVQLRAGPHRYRLHRERAELPRRQARP